VQWPVDRIRRRSPVLEFDISAHLAGTAAEGGGRRCSSSAGEHRLGLGRDRLTALSERAPYLHGRCAARTRQSYGGPFEPGCAKIEERDGGQAERWRGIKARVRPPPAKSKSAILPVWQAQLYKNAEVGGRVCAMVHIGCDDDDDAARAPLGTPKVSARVLICS